MSTFAIIVIALASLWGLEAICNTIVEVSRAKYGSPREPKIGVRGGSTPEEGKHPTAEVEAFTVPTWSSDAELHRLAQIKLSSDRERLGEKINNDPVIRRYYDTVGFSIDRLTNGVDSTAKEDLEVLKQYVLGDMEEKHD